MDETGEDMLPLAQRLREAVEVMHAEWAAAREAAARAASAAAQAGDDRRTEHAVSAHVVWRFPCGATLLLAPRLAGGVPPLFCRE